MCCFEVCCPFSSSAMEKLDLIIFGATGFTGKQTVKNLPQIIKTMMVDNCSNFSWGISGRSKEKIQNLLTELDKLGHDTNIPVIYIDITKDDIKNVTSRARVVVNCTGPNTVLSEPIVKACIETGTHYVDVSAEGNHVFRLFRDFHKKAEEAKVVVVPACGFSAVPPVVGLMHLERNFKGNLNTVDCYMELNIPKRAYLPGPKACLAHSGTWESLVCEWQNISKYRQNKNEIYSDIHEPALQEKRSYFRTHKRKLWFSYPGPDKDIVDMSQKYLCDTKGTKPYHFNMYATMPAAFLNIIIIPIMFLYYVLCGCKVFRRLISKHPGVFTAGYMTYKGPTEEMAKNTKFTMKLIGKGLDESLSQKSLGVKVSGHDPYGTTSKLVAIAALTILMERHKIPQGGGVLPISTAFQETRFMDNLIKNESLEYELLTT